MSPRILPVRITLRKKVPMRRKSEGMISGTIPRKNMIRPLCLSEECTMKRIMNRERPWSGTAWSIRETWQKIFLSTPCSDRSSGPPCIRGWPAMVRDICTTGAIFFTNLHWERIPVIWPEIKWPGIYPNVLIYLITPFCRPCIKTGMWSTGISVSMVRICSVLIRSTVICLCGRFPGNGSSAMSIFCRDRNWSITWPSGLLMV